MMFAMRISLPDLRVLAHRFWRDQQGSLSIETVVILPLLLFATTAGLGYWNAFNSNSRTAKVAYTVADIASRYTSVDDVDMAYLFNLQNKMLPGNVVQRTMRISSVCFEEGALRVLWSHSVASDDVLVPLPPLGESDE